MQSVRVWRHEREQWIREVRSQVGLATFVDFGDIRKHSTTSWVLRPRGSRLTLSPDFVLIFPATTTLRATFVACEFADSLLSEEEIRTSAKSYASTHVDGLALIQRFCGGQDQFFEFSFYDFDGLRPLEQPDENSEQHVSFIDWSKNLYHSKPILQEN